MDILQIPALNDNYIFLLVDRQTQTAAVVDPAEAGPVLSVLQGQKLKLTAILNTHHHGDHVGGNRDLKRHFPGATVYASQADQGRIPEQIVYLLEGDRVEFGGRSAEVLFVPGHTRGHIAYYFPPTTAEEPGELFCGDTLFAGGCGRLFEGTPAQMVESLGKLRSLPDQTRVWCAHEYTLNNLKFAVTVEPDNVALKERLATVQHQRQKQEPTVPSLLGLEKITNPFLRWDQPALQKVAGSGEPARVLGKIRGKKDLF